MGCQAGAMAIQSIYPQKANICPPTSVTSNSAHTDVEYDVPNPMLEEEDDLPTFKHHGVLDPNSDTVFALAACSIPCTDITVTLSIVSGACCFDVDDNQDIYMVGSGVITASVSPSSGGSSGGQSCGPLTVFVNGNTVPLAVSDGDLIVVTLIATGAVPSNCCPCTLETVTNPCVPSMYILRGNKVILNKTEIIRRINQIRKIKITEKLRKLKT
jgi:hypothetical protein